MTPVELVTLWLTRADELAPYAAPAAEAFRCAANELSTVLSTAENEILTLGQAAAESGYSHDSLRHLVSDGKVPNAGRRGAPLIRRGDLPRRPQRTASSYDAGEDALSIVRRKA